MKEGLKRFIGGLMQPKMLVVVAKNKHLFLEKPNLYHRMMCRFWNKLGELLDGKLAFSIGKTFWGFYLHGWNNFELDLGSFCRIDIDVRKDRGEIMVSFLLHQEEHHCYWRYQFGHTLEKTETGTFLSQWRWGRYRPIAPDANIVWEGKILGFIGFGEKPKEESIFEFDYPLSIFGEIISKFIGENGWRVCSCEKDDICNGNKCEYAISWRKTVPCYPGSYLRSGDIIMFSDYDSNDDRFQVITKEDIDEWKQGWFSLLPEGIVFRPSEAATIPKLKKILEKIAV